MRIVGRGGPGHWAEIVGVVADARNNGAGMPIRPEVFIPMEQGRDAWNQLFLMVRSDRDGAALVPSIRAAVASIDPEQPVYAIQTMEEAVALSSFQQRISAMLLGIFATLALVLAAVGIYGVMSYSVSARTQEIGVRMAIGAERIDVLRLVLMQVARLAVVGLVAGVALLLLAGKALTQLLYGVKPADPLTIAGRDVDARRRRPPRRLGPRLEREPGGSYCGAAATSDGRRLALRDARRHDGTRNTKSKKRSFVVSRVVVSS